MNPKSNAPTRRTLLAGASALAASSAFAGNAAAQDAVLDFSGRSVLITGTSSGFGRLTALTLARFGATVIASMRNLDGGARPEARDLMTISENEDLNLHTVEIDVTDDASVASGVAEAEGIAGGALDVVVNNAGIGVAGPVELSDMTMTRLMFETNLFGYLRVANAALPKMREKGAGQIFNVSSQLGRFVIPSVGLYCSTKFGLEALFETMAYELAPHGIEITIIQPGGYPTRIWENGRRYTDDWMGRVSEEKKAAYETHIQMATALMSGDYQTNPIDVPNAIAEIMAMPAGTRPLRRAVHPNPAAAVGANTALAQVQAGVLGQGAYASWHAAVTD